MKNYRFIYLILIVLSLSSCSQKVHMMKGDKFYKAGKLFLACDHYSKAYKEMNSKKDSDFKVKLAEKIGDSYLSINKNRKAYVWYRKAAYKVADTSAVHQKLVNLAYLMGKNKDLYKYNTKKGLVPDGFTVNTEIKRYVVSPFDVVNTRYDDYCPVFKGADTTELYFSSNRRVRGKKLRSKSPVSGRYFSNIYKSVFTDELKRGKRIKYLDFPEWMTPVMLCDSTVNSRYDEGVVSFVEKGNRMFFTSTRLLYRRNDGAKIYQSRSVGDVWKEIKLVKLVADSLTVGHPAVSPDGDRLYFAATLDGGFGKSDIWYVEQVKGKWCKPINAGGIINSEGNEKFPYVSLNNDLFFASDGHNGYGGLDIFRVNNIKGEISIQNMGMPMNSKADDFGVVYYPGEDRGFLTSSRGKLGDDNIYSFAYDPLAFTLNVQIQDSKSGEFLSDVSVKIVNDKGYMKRVVTDSLGVADVSWLGHAESVFMIYKKGYLKTKFIIDTRDEDDSAVFTNKISLNKMDEAIVIPNIFYDVDKWTLRPESEKAMKQLVAVLEDNRSVTIELSANTDMIGESDYNNELSKRRAQSVVDFLIEHGVEKERLTPKGNGESNPKVVSRVDAELYNWLKEGQLLTSEFINSLDKQRQEIANQLNRRTEFRVLRKDYIPKR